MGQAMEKHRTQKIRPMQFADVLKNKGGLGGGSGMGSSCGLRL